MVEVDPPAAAAPGGGLFIASNDTILSFLRSAAQDSSGLSPEQRSLASILSSQRSVSYRSIRELWNASSPSARPRLADLFVGAEFVFNSPKPREKSEELKERLRKLTELAEKKAYQELVRDIVPKVEDVEPFSSYKDQIGFGMHVVLLMFTGYLVGFATFRALFNHNTVMNAAGGIVGLVLGLLLETVLFIIRTSSKDSAATRTASKLKKQQ